MAQLTLAERLDAAADDLSFKLDGLRALARLDRSGKLQPDQVVKVKSLLRSVENVTEKLRTFGSDDSALSKLLDEA